MDHNALMRMAYQEALKSPDPSTQNGGIGLDSGGTIIAKGCNDFTHGMEVTSDLFERPKKYAYIEHAERNVLFDSVWRQSGHIHTLVVPWAACADCARAIVQCGVHTLVRHQRDLGD